MSSQNTDYLVREIKISGSFKNWSDPKHNPQGVSGGSEFEMTVVPNNENPRFCWSPQEAQIVAFDVRMRIHLILMADAQKRGVTLPAEAHAALLRYKEEVGRLRAEAGIDSRTAWKDSEVAPPSAGDLIEGGSVTLGS